MARTGFEIGPRGFDGRGSIGGERARNELLWERAEEDIG